jgi:hypothetical protein
MSKVNRSNMAKYLQEVLYFTLESVETDRKVVFDGLTMTDSIEVINELIQDVDILIDCEVTEDGNN